MRTPLKRKNESRKDATMTPVAPSHPSRGPRSRQSGFSLIELMVALGITLVITGSMYGLIASSQGAFRREPALSDRQQQIRIAMSRIREDVEIAGLGLGSSVQSFRELGNGLGMLGVRILGDPNLGGGNSDFLEIRAQQPDCPSAQIIQQNGGSISFRVPNPPPACYTLPSYVLAIYPNGAAKWAILTNYGAGGAGFVNFVFNQGVNNDPNESQFTSVANASCAVYIPGNGGCPPDPPPPAIAINQPPTQFVKMDRISYRLGADADGTPSLFRSASGGFNSATGTFNTSPPDPAWQLVARGIEDLQIRYRTAAGWQNSAPLIVLPSLDNVVREVEVTMWARTVGESGLQGQTLAAGNLVTAVRGSLTTSIAPRGAQTSLLQEPDPLKRWQ